MSAEEFAGRLAVGRPVFTADRLSEYVTAELDLFERTSPELVVGDFRVSLGVSTAVAGIAYAALTNAHWSPFSIQPFPIPEHPYVRWVGVRAASLVFPLLQPSVFRLHARGFNRVRRRYGLAPVPSLRALPTPEPSTAN